MISKRNARARNRTAMKAGVGTAIAVVVLTSTAACSSPRSAVPEALLANATASTVISGSQTPVNVGGAAANLPLTVPDVPFTSGSWGYGIIFEASGFAPSNPVTLYVGTQTTLGFTTQSTVVNTDPKGNLSSVWTPPTAPTVPAANNDPQYTVWAVQSATATAPALLTTSVFLPIDAAS